MRDNIGNPFSKSFLRYVIAGLVAFDMGRMIGAEKYVFEESGFASRFNSKLEKIRSLLKPLMKLSLAHIDLMGRCEAIMRVYETLSAKGTGALHENQTKCFHVGATKIFHFLNPELFIIVDSNAARSR